jgi:5-methylcytosine-specific restriction endonuclease McrA
MTKPVTRKMAVDCLLHRIGEDGATIFIATNSGSVLAFKCTECGKPIFSGQKIQFDAVHAHKLGGEHGYMDLRPIHYDPCHKNKTARDVKAIAKVKRLRGETCTGPKRKIPSRPFPKTKRPMRGKYVPG